METVAMYLLKMLACSGILYGYYRIALYNERFHQWNRFYLLAAMTLSVVVPFISIPLFTQKQAVVSMVSVMPWNVSMVFTPQVQKLSWQDLVWLAVIITSVVLFARMGVGVARLYLAYRKHPVSKLDEKVHLILTQLSHAPFSFFHWLFWRQDIDPASPNGQRMLEHELTHIREGHSADKLFTELLLCVFWINPFFWLMRRELAMIHEFLADRKAIGHQDGAAFAGMILQAIHVQPHSPLTNPFFSSQIKRRLLMITASKKPQYSYLRRISGLVLMVGAAIALTLTVQQVNAQKQEKQPAAVKKQEGAKPRLQAGKKTEEASQADTLFWKDNNGKLIKAKSIQFDSKTNKAYVISADGKRLNFDFAEGSSNKPLTLKPVEGKPLYIFDGKKISEEEMGEVNAESIQEISVLKDQSAVEKYGEEGKNGVVVITGKPVALRLDSKQGGNQSGERQTLNLGLDSSQNKERVVIGYAGPRQPAAADSIKLGEVVVTGYGRKKTDSNPLVVLDGKRITQEEFNEISGVEIESVNVLKDKAAIEKYGEDGKNGVIEIKTKGQKKQDGLISKYNNVFSKAEKMPAFPGGPEGWRRYLEKALRYPAKAQEAGTQGVALVQFVVDEQGNLSDWRLLTNPGDGLGEEAIRILKQGPKWEPAQQNGHIVAARVEQKIRFQLQ